MNTRQSYHVALCVARGARLATNCTIVGGYQKIGAEVLELAAVDPPNPGARQVAMRVSHAGVWFSILWRAC